MNAAEARKAEEDARRAFAEVEREENEAKWAAEQRVREAFAERRTAAREAVNAAYRARVAAENAEVQPHEWEGKTVVADVIDLDRWSSVSRKKGEVRGVVFTARHGDDFGPGFTYGKPMPGTPMVRLLKKNGEPGLKCERMQDRMKKQQPGAQWRLAE